ncbi:MAG: hypothetical protein LBK53_06505 [Heliobacteriaceae bacterium]|jgi:hypothetical protein|nr:hypothetical protein [Heliobacteriaceae bacterium]
MKLRNNFPHPVLIDNGSDYVNCSFELSETENAKIEGDYLSFDINYLLNSDGLNGLLTTDKAKVLIKAYSPKTAYRDTFLINDTTGINVKIPKNSIAEKVEIYGSIIANQPIKQFCLPEHNKNLFGTTYFEIRKADVLATAKKIVIEVDASELEGPVVSIFNIRKNLEIDTSIKPDFDDEKIDIHLDEKTFNVYNNLKNNLPALKRYLAAVIVFPVLIEALSLIKSSSEDESGYADKRWYRMINKKMADKNIDDLESISITEAANKLLGDIAQEALISLSEQIYRDFDGGFESGGAD